VLVIADFATFVTSSYVCSKIIGCYLVVL